MKAATAEESDKILPYFLANMTTIHPGDPSTSILHQRNRLSPQFILFGDSITQSSHLSFIPLLSTLYSRRLDVVNRGLSGYTSVAALPLLPAILPSLDHSHGRAPHANSKVPLMTIFFGANDASLPGNQQHVPVERYTATLQKMLNYPGIRGRGTSVLLFTTPPVDEWQLQINEGPEPSRRAAVTKTYADAARTIAEAAANTEGSKVVLVDVWRLFMLRAGWSESSDDEYLPGDARREKNEVLRTLLSDGLHFTKEGYELLYGEVERVIRAELPECCPERMNMVCPEWQDVVGNHDWEHEGGKGW